MNRSALGQFIRQSRVARGLTQDDLARVLNTHRVSITNLENGKMELTFEMAVTLSRFLGFTLDGLSQVAVPLRIAKSKAKEPTP